ncbi:hypothetical protein AB0K11_12090 [Mycobacterium sp. NPDC050551]|uniref:hypothetical protein n=1 Tax=Mycobacterium sp. NPDC050551 TaxID=3155407 RepID=UPI00343E7845
MTGPAVPIRAFVESFMLSQQAGDLAYAYPGFERAVPETDSGVWITRPALDVPSKKEAVGNILHHIASVERTDDSVTAVVCRYTYRLAYEVEDGSYRSVARVGPKDERGIHVVLIGLTGSSSPIPPQAGPRPDPVNDVFGEWHVRGMLDSLLSDAPGFREAWPTYEADNTACVENAPDPTPVRTAIIDGTHPRSEFPTAPASPGWPDGSST